MDILKRTAAVIISAAMLVTFVSCNSRATGTMQEATGNTGTTSGTGIGAGGQTDGQAGQQAEDTSLQTVKRPGLYPAQENYLNGGKWGYIDNTGKFAIEPQYSQAEGFQENGLAVVYKDGKAGIIDSSGRFVAEPVYNYITDYQEGLAIASDDKGSVALDDKGKQISGKYSYISNYRNGRAIYQTKAADGAYIYGYLDKSGKPVIQAAYQSATEFEDDKATVMLSEQQYALIDLNGNITRTFNYDHVGRVSDGLMEFRRTGDEKSGYLDTDGNIVIQPAFSYAGDFEDGKALVTAADGSGFQQYGLIDRTGRFLIQPKYSDIRRLGENRIAVGIPVDPEFPPSGTRYALADQDGKLLSDFIYYDVLQPYKDGIASVDDGKELYFIDTEGKRVGSLPSAEGPGVLQKDGDMIYVNAGQRPYYMNGKGETVYKPASSMALDGGVTISENKFKPNRDYLVYFPVFSGMADPKVQESLNKLLLGKFVNAKAEAIKPEDSLDYNYSGGFSVGFHRKDLLVLEKTDYDYPKGAAHGMPGREYLHIDLKTGAVYQMKDLFKSGSGYVRVLSDIIGKQMKDKMKSDPENNLYWTDEYKGIAKDQPFYVTGDSLVIYFTPYEIAPYAAGFPEFSVKFDELSGILDKDGAFWRSFN